MLHLQKFYLFGQIQTGGQVYSDASPYDECSLLDVSMTTSVE